nr:hypothetical protein [Tanacetum cinerariifolium]
MDFFLEDFLKGTVGSVDPEAAVVVGTPAAMGVSARTKEAAESDKTVETEGTAEFRAPAAIVEPVETDGVFCNSAGCSALGEDFNFFNFEDSNVSPDLLKW